MERRLKLILLLMTLPPIANSGVAASLFYTGGASPEFWGYTLGTCLCFVLAGFWLWQIKRTLAASPVGMLKAVAVGFAVKLLLLAAFLFAGRYLINVNLSYFAIAFGSGIAASLIAEVFLYFAAVQKIRAKQYSSGE